MTRHLGNIRLTRRGERVLDVLEDLVAGAVMVGLVILIGLAGGGYIH